MRAAGLLADMHAFDPTAMRWAALGEIPSRRAAFGLTSVRDRLLLFGGLGDNSGEMAQRWRR
jgi:hypothetical protein